MATLTLTIDSAIETNAIDGLYYCDGTLGSACFGNPGWILQGAGSNVRAGSVSTKASKWGYLYHFPSATLPKGAIVNSAIITFTAYPGSDLTVARTKFAGNLRARAYPTDPVVGIQDLKDLRGTIVEGANDSYLTTSGVTWDNIDAWTSGVNYTSPDLKTIVQEIVDDSGWASGNWLGIWWDDFEGRSSATATRAAWPTGTGVITLTIEYLTYPTDALLRLKGYRRSYFAPENGQRAAYQMELFIGGIATYAVTPVGSREPNSLTQLTDNQPAGLTVKDYQKWLQNNWQRRDFMIRIWGNYPNYAQWLSWMKGEWKRPGFGHEVDDTSGFQFGGGSSGGSGAGRGW